MADPARKFFEEYCQGKAWPLQRPTAHTAVKDKYEVVVVGAGPAVGHADGFNARTMEVLATLGLEHFVVRHGRPFIHALEYRMTPDGLQEAARLPFNFSPARFGQLHTQHQGQFEKVMLDDLKKYSETGVQWESGVTSVLIDESDAEYPVVVNFQVGEEKRTLRSKFVVGADGAHSVVRRSMGIKMEGDILDELWGVIDFVPDSTFPDIRRQVRVMKDRFNMAGFTVPREKLSDGEYPIRFYVGLAGEDDKKDIVVGEEMRELIRQKKAGVTKDVILQKCQDILHPYEIKVKEGTQPSWWTTYSVGQRLAEKFIVEDSKSFPRVFLIGDACHSHSPRQGQGMNISTQDAYYLSWRLAYAVFGLTNDPATLLRTYADERRPWAERVVTSDKRWNQGSMPVEEVIEEMRVQVLGCGIEELPGFLVSERNDGVEWQGKDILSGILRTGRRLFNVPVKRWADDTPLDIHDDFPSDGRYRILVLAGQDFPQGRSRTATEQICALTQRSKNNFVEAVFVLPNKGANLTWEKDMPVGLKAQAEMRLHYADEKVYDTYGVSPENGAIALIRPDGIVCVTAKLDDVKLIEEMLQRVLVAYNPSSNGTNGAH